MGLLGYDFFNKNIHCSINMYLCKYKKRVAITNMPIVTYIYGGAHYIMVIFVGNGYGNPSSNPGWGSLLFHIAVIHLGKLWIRLFLLELWINNN